MQISSLHCSDALFRDFYPALFPLVTVQVFIFFFFFFAQIVVILILVVVCFVSSLVDQVASA